MTPGMVTRHWARTSHADRICWEAQDMENSWRNGIQCIHWFVVWNIWNMAFMTFWAQVLASQTAGGADCSHL